MKLYFKLSEKAQKEELKKGNEVNEKQIIDLDLASLNEEEREAIVETTRVYNDELIYVGAPADKAWLSSNTSTNRWYSAKSINSLKVVSEVKEEYDAWLKFQARQAKRAELSGFLKEYGAELTFSNDVAIKVGGFREEIKFNDLAEIEAAVKSGELKKAVVAAKTKINNAINEKKKEKDAEAKRREEKKLKIEHAKVQLKKWAEDNGSDLLKLRIKHNQNWYQMALNEYAISKYPEFKLAPAIEAGDYWEVNNGTIEQLQQLEEFSKKYHDAKFWLQRVRIDDEYGTEHHTFITIETEPFGLDKVELVYEIEDSDDE